MHQKPDIELSVIIVTFNNEPEIAECIEAIALSERKRDWEVIVIDNHSQDRTLEIIQQKLLNKPPKQIQPELILNSENPGFTKATNQGLKICNGKFILLLNPDTQVTKNALTTMMNYFINERQIGLVAPQLRYPDGEIQPSCRHFPRRRDLIFGVLGLSHLFYRSSTFNHWKMPNFTHAEEAEVDQPQGACLMTHRKALDDVGLLDERFPMFFSDVDWCKRFREKGWRIIFTPEARVIHQKGTSIFRARTKMIISSHKSFYDYFQKYKTRPIDKIFNFFIGTVLLFTAFLRMVLGD